MMMTFWTGTASAADYANVNMQNNECGWCCVMLNQAFNCAMLAQFDESDQPVCIDEEDAVMHCGCLECHHDASLHAFDP